MKSKQVIYDCKTGQIRIEEVEVEEIEEIVEELPIVQEPTLEDRVLELERVVGEQMEFIERYKLLSSIK